MKIQQWEYALACVLVPVSWGLLVMGVSNWVERRIAGRARSEGDQVGESPFSSLEYHI